MYTEIASEKGTTPSGIPISKGQDPGQFSKFGLGSTAASHAAREPTTGNDQHAPNPRAKDAGDSLSSAAQNLHPSNDESAGDNVGPDFSVTPKNPKITPAKTLVAGTSACTGSGAQNSLESATPHATPVSDARHPAGFGLISSEILAAPEGSGGRPNVSHDRENADAQVFAEIPLLQNLASGHSLGSIEDYILHILSSRLGDVARHGSTKIASTNEVDAMHQDSHRTDASAQDRQQCYAMLCYAVLCCTMLCYANIYTMLYYAMICYAVLCCSMLCYAMVCHAMLCYAVLCCTMLCYAWCQPHLAT